MSPDGGSVYVTNFAGGVSQYDVGAGGALSPKSPATVAAGGFPRGGGEPGRGERLRRQRTPRLQRLHVSQYDVGAGGALAEEPGHGCRRPRPAGWR